MITKSSSDTISATVQNSRKPLYIVLKFNHSNGHIYTTFNNSIAISAHNHTRLIYLKPATLGSVNSALLEKSISELQDRCQTINNKFRYYVTYDEIGDINTGGGGSSSCNLEPYISYNQANDQIVSSKTIVSQSNIIMFKSGDQSEEGTEQGREGINEEQFTTLFNEQIDDSLNHFLTHNPSNWKIDESYLPDDYNKITQLDWKYLINKPSWIQSSKPTYSSSDVSAVALSTKIENLNILRQGCSMGYGTNVINAPFSGDLLFLNITNLNENNSHTFQMACKAESPSLYFRTRYHNDPSQKDSGWREWQEIYNSSNANKPSINWACNQLNTSSNATIGGNALVSGSVVMFSTT